MIEQALFGFLLVPSLTLSLSLLKTVFRWDLKYRCVRKGQRMVLISYVLISYGWWLYGHSELER